MIHLKQKSSRISLRRTITFSSEEHSLSLELSSELDSLTVVKLLSEAVVLEHGPAELVNFVARDGDSEFDGDVTNGLELLGIGSKL